jgi:acyl-CoA ligase (AMP-forming) (exosortase A-associated)
VIVFTFHDLLAQHLAQRGDHPAVVDGPRTITYAALAREVDAVAAWLRQAGVQRGDRVAVHLRKSIEEVVAMFATAQVGAVFVNINSQWTVYQLDYVLRDSGARVLLTEQRRAAELLEAGLPETLERVLVNGTPPADARMTAWSDLSRDVAPPPRCPAIDVDLAALLYTSGSTGKPKGVMLTHLNLVNGARSVATYVENTPQDRLLSVLTFAFDAGLNQLTTAFLVGATVVLHGVVMPAEIIKTLVRERCTGFAAVPPIWIQVVRYLAEVPTALPHLRYITNTGGKIPESILQQMPGVFPGVKIFLMYGLTEAFRSTFLPPELFHQKMGSIGRAIPNVETYIVDPEIGVCGPGQQGELVHRGSLISQGYWNNPQATAEKIKPCPQLRHLIGDEPVCYSGDLIRIDEDGYYWFVGRRDMLIKSSGFRISGTEVEEIVANSGLVVNAVAFGAPDEMLGQAVHVAITTPDHAPPDEGLLLAHCRAKMPHYMVPQKFYHWKGEMPRTASGKLDGVAVSQACLTGKVPG